MQAGKRRLSSAPERGLSFRRCAVRRHVPCGHASARICGFVLLAAAVFFAGCDTLFPDSDDFEPSGTRFDLNPDIRVVSITGRDQGFPPFGTYPLSVNVESRTSSTETDVLPAGLLFRSAENSVQHMLVLKPQSVAADPGGSEVVAGVFCCNEFREIPRSSDAFELGPITDNSGLQEIVGLVRNRDISGSLWMVQRAVWMVTDSTGLNQAYRDSLANLPEEKESRGRGIKGLRDQVSDSDTLSLSFSFPFSLCPSVPLSLSSL